MKLVIAPNKLDADLDNNLPSVFLGGGITSCKLWQNVLIEKIQHSHCIIFNPRRENFDLANPKESEIQIDWEHYYLNMCDILVFYFADETLCPITLFELGGALERNLHTVPPSPTRRQKILVYCEPGYKRKFDVNYQIGLVQKSNMFSERFVYNYETYEEFVEGLMNQIRLHNEKYRKKS